MERFKRKYLTALLCLLFTIKPCFAEVKKIRCTIQGTKDAYSTGFWGTYLGQYNVQDTLDYYIDDTNKTILTGSSKYKLKTTGFTRNDIFVEHLFELPDIKQLQKIHIDRVNGTIEYHANTQIKSKKIMDSIYATGSCVPITNKNKF
jgi:hypothetical protein